MTDHDSYATLHFALAKRSDLSGKFCECDFRNELGTHDWRDTRSQRDGGLAMTFTGHHRRISK
jgi:hypothetical protein